MVRTPLALVLAALGACAPEKDGGSDTTSAPMTLTTSSASSPDDDRPAPVCDPPRTSSDDCCCFSEVSQALLQNSCPTTVVCPQFGIRCAWTDLDCPMNDGDAGAKADITVDDVAALDCALTALRDGTPGQLKWSVNEFDEVGFVDTFYIGADRSVLTHRSTHDDYQYSHGDLTKEVLFPAQKFVFCLAEPELRDRVECLKSVTTGPVSELCLTKGAID